MNRKPVLVFAPCAYNLAETTRMAEIAKAVRRLPGAPFELQFISDGGEFESLIEGAGFPLERLEPRMTPERIEYAYKLDKGEAFGSVMSGDSAIEKIGNELDFLRQVNPVAIVTGSYVTVPITHRILGTPLVWVVQSTWLPGFMTTGAGMTDAIRFRPAKRVADLVIYRMIDLWMKVGLLRPLNKAARHYRVAPVRSLLGRVPGVRIPDNVIVTGWLPSAGGQRARGHLGDPWWDRDRHDRGIRRQTHRRRPRRVIALRSAWCQD